MKKERKATDDSVGFKRCTREWQAIPPTHQHVLVRKILPALWHVARVRPEAEVCGANVQVQIRLLAVRLLAACVCAPEHSRRCNTATVTAASTGTSVGKVTARARSRSGARVRLVGRVALVVCRAQVIVQLAARFADAIALGTRPFHCASRKGNACGSEKASLSVFFVGFEL